VTGTTKNHWKGDSFSAKGGQEFSNQTHALNVRPLSSNLREIKTRNMVNKTTLRGA